MCYACLLELQEKLLQVSGVERFRAAKSEQVSIQSFGADLSNFADVIVYYDASKVNFPDIKAYIRSSGYYPYKIVDKEVSSVPAEDAKKI
jgi:hypothetical protein